jgi:hypothetical protein
MQIKENRGKNQLLCTDGNDAFHSLNGCYRLQCSVVLSKDISRECEYCQALPRLITTNTAILLIRYPTVRSLPNLDNVLATPDSFLLVFNAKRMQLRNRLLVKNNEVEVGGQDAATPRIKTLANFIFHHTKVAALTSGTSLSCSSP